jgi:adenosylcobinamide kinase/adenosylcobinamide-phosphate guanylyltransferase
MEGRFVLLIGGARCGKSRYAVELAERIGGKTLFIATCIPTDQEMKQRIQMHKRDRPRWETIEVSGMLSHVFHQRADVEVFILDCLTLFISGLLMQNYTEADILGEVELCCEAIKGSKKHAIWVSNEVGCGVVPVDRLARLFRDVAGRANQLVARYADEVYLIVAGLPLALKR